MSGAIDANAKPLPVVLKAARDELLSSWLARHARFYGVTGSFFAKWLGLGDFRLSALDYRLGLEQVARLTEKFRCDPVTLIDMTQINTLDGQVCSLISRGRPLQICYPCADRYAHDGAEGAIPKHWSKAWRITCPACGLAFTDTTEHRGSRATLLETTPFEDLWSEAVAGEQIVERYIADGKPAEHSPIAVLRLLLVQTWKPITGDLEHPVVGWVLGTLFPNFDVRARPIKRRVTHMSIASLPIEFRPALLARAGPCIGQSGGAPGSTQGNPSAGSTELRQILPGSKFRTAAGPPVKPSIVRTWPADILTIDGQIQKTFHILIPRWRLTTTASSDTTRQRLTNAPRPEVGVMRRLATNSNGILRTFSRRSLTRMIQFRRARINSKRPSVARRLSLQRDSQDGAEKRCLRFFGFSTTARPITSTGFSRQGRKGTGV